jgi:hypothetical protein
VKANTAIARARSAGSVNIVTRIPRLTATAIALPIPCRNRAASSTAPDVATPASSEAAVNTAVPARNISRLPSRSPSRPASSSRLPNATR